MEVDKQKVSRVLELEYLINHAINCYGESPAWFTDELNDLINELNSDELDYTIIESFNTVY
jgi:hypothetical protein